MKACEGGGVSNQQVAAYLYNVTPGCLRHQYAIRTQIEKFSVLPVITVRLARKAFILRFMDGARSDPVHPMLFTSTNQATSHWPCGRI